MRAITAMTTVLLVSSLSGCISGFFDDEQIVGCPDNNPDGTICSSEENGQFMYGVGTDFSGLDLSNADFVGAILVNANFSGSDLSGADLGRANIRGANFAGADLSGTIFFGAIYDSETSFWDSDGTTDSDGNGIPDLFDPPGDIEDELVFIGPGADLRGVNLDMLGISWTPEMTHYVDGDGDGYGDYSVYFPSANPLDLRGANLSGASLGSPLILLADFSGADLTGVNFHGSGIVVSNFTDADLTGANLTGASFMWSDFTGVDLTGAEIHDLEARLLMGCPKALPMGWLCMPTGDVDTPSCPEEDPEYSEMMGDLLDVFDMSDCTFNLIGPTMGGRLVADGVDLTGLDMGLMGTWGIQTQNLTGCPSNLHEAYLCTGGVILGPGVWASHSNLSGMDLSGIDLSESALFNINLSGANLSGANLSGVSFEGADLSGAVLGGADINDVSWVAHFDWGQEEWYDTTVICPDGTDSNDNDDGCVNNLGP